MSAKSESLPAPQASHKLVPTEIVELHWPDNEGVELVQVLLVEKTHAVVERLDFFNHEDARARVRREWLRRYENA